MKPKIFINEIQNIFDLNIQTIHTRIQKNKLTLPKLKNKYYFDTKEIQKIAPLKIEPKTIAFQIRKGGAGKTTLAHSISIRLSLLGFNVLCIDMDSQSNLTSAFDIPPSKKNIFNVLNNKISINDAIIKIFDCLSLLPAGYDNEKLDEYLYSNDSEINSVYKKYTESLKKDFDFIIFDCPPNLGRSVVATTLASDMIIAPTLIAPFCIQGLIDTYQEFQKAKKIAKQNIEFRILINRFSGNLKEIFYAFENTGLQNIIFDSLIKDSVIFKNTLAEQKTIFDSSMKNRGKEDIDSFIKEFLQLNND